MNDRIPFTRAYRSQIEANESIRPEHKHWVITGIDHLVALLGETYFAANEENYTLPFSHEMINSAAWTRYGMADLGHRLNTLRPCKNFTSVLRRVKRPEGSLEAHTLVNIGFRFFNSGFDVVFEPEVEAFPKKPDIQCIDRSTGQRFFIEVAVLGRSDKSRIALDASLPMMMAMMTPGVEMRTDIHCLDTKEDADQLSSAIKTLAAEVRTTGNFRELQLEDVAHLAAAPFNSTHHMATLKAWSTRHGMGEGVISQGPRFNRFDNLSRISGKMVHEHKQVPEGHPNIVVIYTPDFLSYLDDRHVAQLGSFLEKEASAYTNSICTVLVSEASAWSVDKFEDTAWSQGNHFYSKRIHHPHTVETFVGALNPNYKGLVTQTIRDIVACLKGPSSTFFIRPNVS